MKKAVLKEQKIREYWQENDTFHASVRNREGKKPYVFYEGPPTANGMPHAGHALGRTIKDFIARYKTMDGYQVKRKAGWDTHGLPVELEVEKQLKISGKDQIETYGIERFIEKCKESVFTYEREWKQFTEALGYWVDMEDPYITLDNSYIESVWHILSHIHEEGLLYKGHRVVPYCPHCETSLSSHEVAQGYKDVSDLSATAKFLVEGTTDEYLLGWTTTPWTLPANVAIAVHPDLTYVTVQQENEKYIVAEGLAKTLFKEDFKVVASCKGKDLAGVRYEAPFSYIKINKGHEVVLADFVTDQSGTGLVHIAPAYGEDDYRVVQDNDLDFVHIVDGKGRYTEEITPLAGRFVKNSDVDIIRLLAERNRLFHKEKYTHSYPHCWRCDSPLLYYAMEGWFIRMTDVKEKMQENNQKVEWHPGHMQEGRFGKFLDNMVDWNIGRNRYWGTPLNVWTCKCGKVKAPGSIAELRQEAIGSVPENVELHKPYVDQIQLRCECGDVMQRTSEVIDVWFDSGSMPFAQYHYPFGDKKLFESQYPADVVIEGVDQTRGWFYSLLAVSTLMTGKAPYKRVLSLGHILDENGQKMSKSKGNALNPTELMETYGADALRWALLSDSAPWNNKRFSERTVAQAKSKMIDTLSNVFSFYQLYQQIDQFDGERDSGGVRTTLDEWVLSRLHSVTKQVNDYLEQYDITNAARELGVFLDELSNWYVRRSRQRFWSSGMTDDKRAAFSTLYEVLKKTAQLLAPFTPYIAEDIYLQLTGCSVHLTDYPKPCSELINIQLEKDMTTVRQVVELTRAARNAAGIKTKQPLAALYVLGENDSERLVDYTETIKDETNVKEIELKEKEGLFTYSVKLDFATAGPRLGKRVGEAKQALAQIEQLQIKELIENGKINISDLELSTADVILEKVPSDQLLLSEGNGLSVLLDTKLTTELKEEGFVREVIREVQTYRKELDLPVEKRVNLYVDASPAVIDVMKKYTDMLYHNLVLQNVLYRQCDKAKSVEVDGEHLHLGVE
ncbi:Isoleucyl-tRNA synthetase [Terribacillus saccharophilus]|uniref:Isoleucine--tRNA ligase n=1 Tax=Terribacillus saccharophilus TaxID=361277 RepID=A0AAX2EJG8_9BACI|nr:isoleucine--tRNA ligase [Terribacillus saccharophilus]MEC0291011.1 isoleucine--tRNA ligase [Terribacillus saccharophilus]SEO02461.1 Isoleucyl-tRNA synthetase [Terribacillus saccharophilus]